MFITADNVIIIFGQNVKSTFWPNFCVNYRHQIKNILSDITTDTRLKIFYPI